MAQGNHLAPVPVKQPWRIWLIRLGTFITRTITDVLLQWHLNQTFSFMKMLSVKCCHFLYASVWTCINGLVHDCGNSITNALESKQSLALSHSLPAAQFVVSDIPGLVPTSWPLQWVCSPPADAQFSPLLIHHLVHWWSIPWSANKVIK